MATMEEEMMLRFMESMEKAVTEFKEHQQGLDVALQAFLELNHIKCPPWLQKACSTATEKACNPSYGEPLNKSCNPSYYRDSLVKYSNPSFGEPLDKASNPTYGKSSVSNPIYGEPLVKTSNPSYGEPLVKASNPSCGENLAKVCSPGCGEPRDKVVKAKEGDARRTQKNHRAVSFLDEVQMGPLLSDCSSGANVGAIMTKQTRNAHNRGLKRDALNNPITVAVEEVFSPPPPVPVEAIASSSIAVKMEKEATTEGMGKARGSKRGRKECVEVVDCSVGVTTRRTRNNQKMGSKRDASNCENATVEAPSSGPVSVEAIDSSSIAVKMEKAKAAEVGEKEGISHIGTRKTRVNTRGHKHVQDIREVSEPLDCSCGVIAGNDHNSASKKDASSSPVSVEVIASSLIAVKMEEEEEAAVGEKEGISHIGTVKTRGNKRGLKHVGKESREVSEPLDYSGRVLTRNDHNSGSEKDASSSPVSVEVIASSSAAVKMEEEEVAEVGEKEGISHIGTDKSRSKRGLKHAGKENREVLGPLDCSGGVMTRNDHDSGSRREASPSPVSVEVIASLSIAMKMEEEEVEVEGEKEAIINKGTGKTRGNRRGQKHGVQESGGILEPLDCSGGVTTRNDHNSGSKRDAASSPVSVEVIASLSIAMKMEEEEVEGGEKKAIINKGTGKTRGNKRGQKHGVQESGGILEPLDCSGGVMTRNYHNSGSKRGASSSPVSVEVADSLSIAVKMEEGEAEVEREEEGIIHIGTGKTRENKRGHKHVVQESREVLEPLDYSDGVITRNDRNSGLEKDISSSGYVEVIPSSSTAVKMEEEEEAEVEGEREVDINKGTGETRGNNRGQNHVVQESREVSVSLDCLGGVTGRNDHNRDLKKDASPSPVSVEVVASSSIAVKMEEEEADVGEKEPIINYGTGKTRGNKRGCKNVGKEKREISELLNCAGGNAGGGVMTRRTRNYHNRGLKRDTVNCDIAAVEAINSSSIAVKTEESEAEGFEAVKPFAGEAFEAIRKKTKGLKRGCKQVGKGEEVHSRLSLSLQLGELETGGEKKSIPPSTFFAGPESLLAVVEYKEASEKNSRDAGRSKQPIRNVHANEPSSVPFEMDKGWIRLATDLEDPKSSIGEEPVRLCEENAQAQKEMPRIACKEGTPESLQEFDLNIPFAEATTTIESSDRILSKPLTKHTSDSKVCLVFGVQSLQEEERLLGHGICLNITDGFGNGMVADDKSHSSRKKCKIVEESDRNGGSSLPSIPLEVALVSGPTESRKKPTTLTERVIINRSKSSSPLPHNTRATETEAQSEKTIANDDLNESVKRSSKRSKTLSSLLGFRRSSRKKTIHKSLSSPCENKVTKTSDLNVANGGEQLQQPSPIESKTLPYQIKISPSPLGTTSESEGKNVSPKLSSKLNEKPVQTIALCDTSGKSSIHADRHSLEGRMSSSPLGKTSESEGETHPTKLSGELPIQIKMSPSPLGKTNESEGKNAALKLSDKLNQKPEQTIAICDTSRKSSIHADRHSLERRMSSSPSGKTSESLGEIVPMKLSGKSTKRNLCTQRPEQTIPICDSSRKGSIHTDRRSFERKMSPSLLGETNDSEGKIISMRLSDELMESNPSQKPEQTIPFCHSSRKSSIHTDRNSFERRTSPFPLGKTRQSEGETVSMKLSDESMEGNPCTQKTEQTIDIFVSSRKSSINTDRHSLEKRMLENGACNDTLLSTNCLVPSSEMSPEALNSSEPLSHGTEGAFPEGHGHAEMVLGLEDVAEKRGMFSGISGTIYPMEISRGSMEGSESLAIEIDAPVLASFLENMGLDTPRMEYPYGSRSDYGTGGREKRTPLTPAYTNLYDKNSDSPGKRSLFSFDLQCFRIEEEFEGKENANPDVFSSCKSNNKKFSAKKKEGGGGGLSNRKGLANRMTPISDTDGRPFNVAANVRSFLPLIQQKQPTVPYPNGKRDVKVKALQAAEAAKRAEERREQERRLRKLELAKAEKEKLLQPKNVSEHLFINCTTFDSEDIVRDSIAISESQCTMRNRMLFPKVNSIDNASDAGTSPLDVLSKVKRVAQQKQKLEEMKAKHQEEGQRKKEEERKKKEADFVARKRKREEAEKKEREEKRKRVEEVQRVRKEQEERQRLELEQKEQRRKALEERERERKALEEEAKRQRRIDKEKEAERRRRQEQEAKSILQAEKELKKKKHETEHRIGKLADEGYHELEKLCTVSAVTFGEEQQLRGGKISGVQRSMSNQYRTKLRTISGLPNLLSMSIPVQNCNTNDLGLQRGGSINQSDVSNVGSMEICTDKITRLLAAYPPPSSNRRIEMAAPAQIQATLDEGIEQSYEISPYKSSSDDEDEEEGNNPSKPFPIWTRKENLMVHLWRQQSMDPDTIFLSDKTCSLQEIFGTVGSKRRRDFTQRSGSGDWLEDRVTWKEEMEYKKSMGYIKPVSS